MTKDNSFSGDSAKRLKKKFIVASPKLRFSDQYVEYRHDAV